MKTLREHSKWFLNNSRNYAATGGYGKTFISKPFTDCYDNRFTFTETLYLPIAYIKFIWYSRFDIKGF